MLKIMGKKKFYNFTLKICVYLNLCINTCKVPQIMFDGLLAMCSNSFLGTGDVLMHEVTCITTILFTNSWGSDFNAICHSFSLKKWDKLTDQLLISNALTVFLVVRIPLSAVVVSLPLPLKHLQAFLLLPSVFLLFQTGKNSSHRFR